MIDINLLLPILSGLILLSVSLVKILEILIKFIVNKYKKTKSEKELITDVLNYLSDEKKSILSDDEKFKLKIIFEIINKTDENGLPFCYFPRSFEHNQEELVHVMNKLVSYEEKSTLILEYILDRLNNLEKK